MATTKKVKNQNAEIVEQEDMEDKSSSDGIIQGGHFFEEDKTGDVLVRQSRMEEDFDKLIQIHSDHIRNPPSQFKVFSPEHFKEVFIYFFYVEYSACRWQNIR